MRALPTFLNTRSGLWLFILQLLFVFPSCKISKEKADTAEPAYEVNMKEVKIVSRLTYQETPKKVFALKHTMLEIEPLWKTQELKGVATLTLSPYTYPQDSLELDAKRLLIHEIELVGNDRDQDLKFRYDSLKLHIALDKTYQPGEELKIRINYTARPNSIDESDSASNKRIDKGLYFINPTGQDSMLPRELWSQGETEYNSAWFPTLDVPNQKHTQEIFITVDTSFTTLSNGTLVYSTMNKNGKRTDCWEMKQPEAPYLTMIAVGNWAVVKDNWRDSIPVDYYVEPQYKQYAKMVFGKTPAMIEYYSKILHYDYPWPKFSQVVAREFVSGAMENTTAVVHYDELQHDARAHLDETNEDVICHELFHHWFGDLVTTESWANLALNESFATLGEDLWLGHEYGKDEEAYHRQLQLNAYLLEATYKMEPIINHYYTNREDLFDRHRYEKGGLVLNMLRNYLGDTVFFKGLNIYLTRHAYGTAEIVDLRLALEDASGMDLSWFFDLWFKKQGHPVLTVSQQYRPQEKKLFLYVEQAQPDYLPLFNYPVKLDIYTPQGKISKDIWFRDRKDTFVFDLADAPLLVNFDPDRVLLGKTTEIKSNAQWYYQYFHEKNYWPRYDALRVLTEKPGTISNDSMDKLVDAALKDPFWNIRQLVYSDILNTTDQGLRDKYASQAGQAAFADKNPKVRAAALSFLAENQRGAGLGLYRKALSDSSYEVVATAINLLLQYTPEADSAALLQKLIPCEAYPSAPVSMALADVYARYPNQRQRTLFRLLPYRIKSYQWSRFLDAYSRWILTLDAANLKNEIPFIMNLTRYQPDTWGLVSYKALLNKLVQQLRTGYSGGFSEQERESLIKSLENKSNSLKIGG